MTKEIDVNNVALFQDGKLMAFGHLNGYSEEDGEFKTNVIIEKGTLNCGEQLMQICREYDVMTDNVGFSIQ